MSDHSFENDNFLLRLLTNNPADENRDVIITPNNIQESPTIVNDNSATGILREIINDVESFQTNRRVHDQTYENMVDQRHIATDHISSSNIQGNGQNIFQFPVENVRQVMESGREIIQEVSINQQEQIPTAVNQISLMNSQRNNRDIIAIPAREVIGSREEVSREILNQQQEQIPVATNQISPSNIQEDDLDIIEIPVEELMVSRRVISRDILGQIRREQLNRQIRRTIADNIIREPIMRFFNGIQPNVPNLANDQEPVNDDIYQRVYTNMLPIQVETNEKIPTNMFQTNTKIEELGNNFIEYRDNVGCINLSKFVKAEDAYKNEVIEQTCVVCKSRIPLNPKVCMGISKLSTSQNTSYNTTSCNAVFCSFCYIEMLNRSGNINNNTRSCPICRREFSQMFNLPSRKADLNKLGDILIKCDWSRCSSVFPINQFLEHKANCPFIKYHFCEKCEDPILRAFTNSKGIHDCIDALKSKIQNLTYETCKIKADLSRQIDQFEIDSVNLQRAMILFQEEFVPLIIQSNLLGSMISKLNRTFQDNSLRNLMEENWGLKTKLNIIREHVLKKNLDIPLDDILNGGNHVDHFINNSYQIIDILNRLQTSFNNFSTIKCENQVKMVDRLKQEIEEMNDYIYFVNNELFVSEKKSNH